LIQAAITLLESSKPFDALIVQGDAMFVAGTEESDSAQKLQDLVEAYTREGGRTILLGAWLDEFAQMKDFATRFGVEWECSWYRRTSYEFNKGFSPLREGAGATPPLTPTAFKHLSRPLKRAPTSGFSLLSGLLGMAMPTRGSPFAAAPPEKAVFTKALNLDHVASKDALYLPTPGAHSSMGGQPVDSKMTPAAMTKVGNGGWLGYVGDVEMDEEMAIVVLAMAGCEIEAGSIV
jgi:hypothetical protein